MAGEVVSFPLYIVWNSSAFPWAPEGVAIVRPEDLFSLAYEIYLSYKPYVPYSELSLRRIQADLARMQTAVEARDGVTLMAFFCTIRRVDTYAELQSRRDAYPLRDLPPVQLPPPRTDREAKKRAETLPETERPCCRFCAQVRSRGSNSTVEGRAKEFERSLSNFTFSTKREYTNHLRTKFHRKNAWYVEHARECTRVDKGFLLWMEKQKFGLEALRSPLDLGEEIYLRTKDLYETLVDWRKGRKDGAELPEDEAKWPFPNHQATYTWYLVLRDLRQPI